MFILQVFMKILVKSQTTFSQQRSCFGINIFSSCVISGYLWNLFMVLDENESAIDEDKILEQLLRKSGAAIHKAVSGLFRFITKCT